MERADDTDAKQQAGGGWAGLFGGGGQAQGQAQGGLSPSRNADVKKAIRAAMAFGLPRATANRGSAASPAPTDTSTTTSDSLSAMSGSNTQGDGVGDPAREGSEHGRGKGARYFTGLELEALVVVR